MQSRPVQQTLFDYADPLPQGLAHEPEFLAPGDERELITAFDTLPFHEARYRAYTARRRVVRYGAGYESDEDELNARLPFPEFLVPLRSMIAAWAAIPAERFAHVLVTEYRPGTPLGWHRDAPHFETVVGVSLAGLCRMRFRPRAAREDRNAVVAIDLEPRSVYVMRGPVRWDWEHNITPTPELRYSVTFRTMRPELEAQRAAPRGSSAKPE